MNSTQNYKSSKLLLGLIAALSTAALAATKFPYVGQWSKNVEYADGSIHQIVLTFANNGSCSYKVNGLKFSSKTECSYRMQGTSAILNITSTGVFKGVKNNGIVTAKVTPQADGQAVSMQPLEWRTMNMKNGKWTSNKAKAKPFILSRLK